MHQTASLYKIRFTTLLFITFDLFIIKETALSKGCDAGVHKDVLLHKINCSDIILSGTIKQLTEISKSLNNQPFGIKEISKKIINEIDSIKKHYNPKIMGIINLTEDSFSKTNKFLNDKEAIEFAIKLLMKGRTRILNIINF